MEQVVFGRLVCEFFLGGFHLHRNTATHSFVGRIGTRLRPAAPNSCKIVTAIAQKIKLCIFALRSRHLRVTLCCPRYTTYILISPRVEQQPLCCVTHTYLHIVHIHRVKGGGGGKAAGRPLHFLVTTLPVLQPAAPDTKPIGSGGAVQQGRRRVRERNGL